jgi:hypothetical protein
MSLVGWRQAGDNCEGKTGQGLRRTWSRSMDDWPDPRAGGGLGRARDKGAADHDVAHFRICLPLPLAIPIGCRILSQPAFASFKCSQMQEYCALE